MKHSITRRDILKLTGGGFLGMMLSPLPWKLLDDSAIWTQNWERTPKLSHSPITLRYSNCTMCNAGCGISMKCIDGRPYYVSGVRNHPLTYGALCARGIAGHHMANHPLRIIHPHTFTDKTEPSRMKAISRIEAITAVAAKIRSARGTVVILDQQPNRAISSLYRDFLHETGRGIFVTSPATENRTAEIIRTMSGNPSFEFGYDLEHASLVLSFGAPLFDGWGVPGRMNTLKNSASTKFIQIEDRRSRTAMQSHEWISIVPGMERYLALSIANVLFREQLIRREQLNSIKDLTMFRTCAEQFAPETTAPFTGVSAERVRMLARELASASSAVILSGSDAGGGPFDEETERNIASLNILLGSVGRSGSIVSRQSIPGTKEHPAPAAWSSIPDHSVEVLMIDAADSGCAIPWKLVEQKLVSTGRCVVSLSPILNEISAHADFLIPAPAYLESLSESPSPESSNRASFALSSPAMPLKEYCVEPIDVIRDLCVQLFPHMSIPTQEGSLKERCDAVYSSHRGSLFQYAEQKPTPVKEFSSADDVWTALMNGAVWMDDPSPKKSFRTFTIGLTPTMAPPVQVQGLQLVAHGWKGTTSSSQMSPILSKIFQESDLRNLNGTVSIHPATAAALGLNKDDVGIVKTNNGTMAVRIKIDPNCAVSMILAAVGPQANGKETPLHPAGTNILNLCDVKQDGTWRITSAELMKA